MVMKPIKETIKQAGQYVIKYEDNKTPVFLAAKIAAGIAWPTAEKDGYFCIIASRADKEIVPGVETKPVAVLVEGEHALLPALFDALAAQVQKVSCTTIYAQYNPAVVNKPGFDGRNKAFVLAFNDYKRKRHLLSLLRLQPPLISDWLVGILTAQKWRVEKALNIPQGSIMHNQLKSMVITDRKPAEQDKFPAMMALICAMTPFVGDVAARGQGLRKVVPSKYAW